MSPKMQKQTQTPLPPNSLEPSDEIGKREETYQIATQWQLIWWKFRKHKAAMIAGPLLLLLFAVAFFCQFLSPTVPGERNSDYRHAPPQLIRFYDPEVGFSFRPFVYDLSMETDQETFRRSFVEDRSKRHYLQFFYSWPQL